MKVLSSGLLIATSLCFSPGCRNQCDDVLCAEPAFSLNLRILSATDSSDLLFGAGRSYNPDSLRFSSLTQGTVWNHRHYRSVTTGTPPDSIIQVSIYNF